MQYLSNYYYFILIIFCVSSTSYAEVLSDPTRPADWQASAPLNTNKDAVVTPILPKVVNAIIIRPQHRVAVIQGKVMMEGEQLEGYTLKKINIDNVVFANTMHTLTLPLISSHVNTIIQYEQ